MTCQLCGKPLPKMRLRRDGDFCCREHREQYRLRRGLNLLQEADELATLRRRRERPTAMGLQRPAGPAWDMPRRISDCSYPGYAHQPEDRFARPLEIVSVMRLPAAGRILALPRGHLGVASYARRGAVSQGIAPRLVLAPPHTAARTAVTEARVPAAMGFLAPRASRLNAAAEPRALNCEVARPRAPLVPRRGTPLTSVRIGESRTLRAPAQPLAAPAAARRGAGARFAASCPLALPAHAPAAFTVYPPAARFAAASTAAASVRAERRAPGELKRCDPRANIRFGEMAARLARPRSGGRLGEARGLKRSAAGGKQAGARHGFAAMAFPTAGPEPGFGGARSPLRATAVPSASQLRAVAPPAPAPPPGERISCRGGWALPAIAQPTVPAPRNHTQARTAPIAPMSVAPGTGLDAMRPRAAAVKRASETAPPAAPPHRAAPLAGGHGELALSAHCLAALAPAHGGSARQTALVPVPRHEPLLNRSPLTLQGNFMGTMEDAGTSVRLEENFATGLNRWVGQIETWRLDAAGVRAGGLALFGPSLGLRDCELEFLAKVENGGVGWVFRAADLNNYYHVRLRLAGTAAKPVWELVRGAMVAGAAEAPVIAPLDLALRAKASFRVQMAIQGSAFTVAVEGQEVARWSDSRLRTGGIGFLAEKDDRARLYWVKVASPAFGVANDE